MNLHNKSWHREKANKYMCTCVTYFAKKKKHVFSRVMVNLFFSYTGPGTDDHRKKFFILRADSSEDKSRPAPFVRNAHMA